jgi:DNA-binding NtrC family response regulator
MNKPTTHGTLLLVDDDPLVLESMADWLRSQGYDVDTSDSVSDAKSCFAKKQFDIALVDIRLGDQDGFELLHHVRSVSPETAVILITGYGTVESAVEAIRSGAFDFLTKPLLDDALEEAIGRALNRHDKVQETPTLKQSNTQSVEFAASHDDIVGSDPRMDRVYDMVDSIAHTRATVLLTGQSGTGKSLIARAVHKSSSRADAPFVEVACGALPENLLESELFGHKAGAFTGAVGDRLGKFDQADGGTIFLDEIGTASPAMQVKLLRVLQELTFEPLGGVETHKVDVRVILATNEDLEELVASGDFRQDLFYRINVINIELPALRERTSDIPLLARHFLKKICDDSGKQVEDFTPDAMESLLSYSWPGNVRQLQNIVERAVLLGKQSYVTPLDLPDRLQQGSRSAFQASASRHGDASSSSTRTLKEALAEPERRIILEVLESKDWNRNATADQLGINRTTLYKKMKRLGLELPAGAE